MNSFSLQATPGMTPRMTLDIMTLGMMSALALLLLVSPSSAQQPGAAPAAQQAPVLSQPATVPAPAAPAMQAPAPSAAAASEAAADAGAKSL